MEHTPGPWYVAMEEDGDSIQVSPGCWEGGYNGHMVYDREGGVFAIVDDEPEEICRPFNAADAALISAAPDLLQAAREALCLLNDIWFHGETARLLEAAIAKAETLPA